MDPLPQATEISTESSASSSSSSAVDDLSKGIAAMSLQDRFALLRGIAEECIQEDELMNLLEKKPVPICYDGFEPSGRMHIAQGIVKTINVNKMVKAGCKVKIWIADWFAQLNNKMGGDLKKIQTVGRYMIEIWKAAEELTAAQIFYPCMQCADIFFLKADICQLGMDQRKVNVLAREYCTDIKRKNKPIILSHHMLPGFKEGQEKMSKSDPTSAIFMEDDEAAVNLKIKQAFCPPNIVEGNPCLEYIKYIVFPWFETFEVVRKEANGGNKTFANMDELIADYESGALHPADVKPALAKAINQILQPIRDHFNNNSEAKVLLNTVKKYRVTN
ncbi:hypothetical protein GUJ93_ZPchr0008g13788 [Zizania palustris]|uniref:tyrosine--tRNA ligase n=1 Tax=Zizania palustris TaxID=103762 RepID=A0A8J5RBK9_ZIZPA|nr:hypothetical protein GUJ93_ZPchr0008g13788 [Zizania palustris]